MTTFLQPDEAGIRSGTKRGQNKRGQNRAACFLHLRSDLVYLQPQSGVGSMPLRSCRVARSGSDR